MRCPVAPPFGGCSHGQRGSGWVQEDPFAVMEACRKAIEEVLKRSVAEGRFIPRGWIDVTYGEEEMALLEEEVLPVLAGVLQRVEEIDAKVRRYRRLIQAEG